MDLTATPPPGKAWVTVELDTADWDSGNFETEDLLDNVVHEEHGIDPEEEDPSDKCNRLLGEAEIEFRLGATTYPFGDPATTGQHLSKGSTLLAEALKVLREEL
jgi:hypothetical protein